MQVIRHKDIKPLIGSSYFPDHHDMAAMPLQTTNSFILSMSVYLPGGHVDVGPVPCDLSYFIVEGEMTIIADKGETIVLGKYDSISFKPGDVRGIKNASNLPVLMLVVRTQVN